MNIVRRNKIIIYPFIIFIVIGTVLYFFFSKPEIHIYINKHHTFFCDQFFKWATYGGDGRIILLLGILLLLFKARYSVLIIGTYLGSGIIVQVLKRFFFSNVHRPVKYFEGIYDLNIVEGVNLHSNHSFPSGHSASAFALFFSLAFIVRNKWLKLLFFFMALLVAFSRVYISQHFLIDIVVGSTIGVITAVVIYHYVSSSRAKWMDTSLIRLFHK